MPTTSACPQVTELKQLANGNLPTRELETLVQHLEECDSCLAKVQTLATTDTLVDVLAKASTLTDSPDEPILAQLIGRLRMLGKKPAETGPSLLTFACVHCGKNLKVKADLAGKKVKCPGCGKASPAPQASGPISPRSSATEGSGVKVSPAAKVSEEKTVLPDAPAAANLSDFKTVLPGAGDTGAGAPAQKPANPGATEAQAHSDADSELWDFLAPPEQPDEIGRLGPYRVLKVLGAGGMGVVFRAEDPHLERPVALKAMLPSLAASPSAKKRFLREAKAAAALKHDHVVAIYQVGEDRGAPFLAMEFLEGEPLDKCLDREGKLSVQDSLRIGREIASGLAAAHAKSLIHRDIKPGNIWLEFVATAGTVVDGAGSADKRDAHRYGRVKILDFGLARSVGDQAGLTQQGAIVGTPAYMAPEQAIGTDVDHRCDLFSLGCVLYRLTTGQLPFKGNNTLSILSSLAMDDPPPPRELNPALSAELSDLIMKLLAKKAEERPASAHAVVDALRALEADEAAGLPAKRPAKTAAAKKQASPVLPSPSGKAADPPPSPSGRGAGGEGTGLSRRKKPLVLVALALVAGLALCLAGGIYGIIRIATPEGDYVIDTDDPDFAFSVSKGTVVLEDKKLKRTYNLKVLKQKSGEFELEVTDPGNDLAFNTKTFSIKRGEKVVLKLWFERKGVEVAKGGSVDDAWLKMVAALPAEQQLKAVTDKLKELNTDFDGNTPTHKLDKAGMVTEFEVAVHVTDISPVRALTGLRRLNCSVGGGAGGRKLVDLSPLKAMPLTFINVDHTSVSDLSPLKEMMTLTGLSCAGTKVSDLAPLKGIKLRDLNIGFTKVSDLSPLRDAKLTSIQLRGTAVSDLSPLKGMPLTSLICDVPLAKGNAEILRSITTLKTINGKSPAEVLGGTPVVVYLDDLKESEFMGHFNLGKHGKRFGAQKQPFTFQGKTFAHALVTATGMPKSVAYVVYDLSGRFDSFQGTAALYDGDAKGEPLLTFRVLGDGKQLWESKPLSERGKGEEFQVSMRGVKKLRLEVSTPGGGIGHAVWIEPRLTPADGMPIQSPPPAVGNFLPLFNGTDLTGWVKSNGQPAAWKVANGELEVVPGQGNIMTAQDFGPDFELHAEFNIPLHANKKGQARGNSGIYLLGRYEIQILDSFNNPQPAERACAALFEKIGPSRNVCKPPNEWQTYDIAFRAPRLDGNKKVVQPGELSVVHNGVLVIDKGRFETVTVGSHLTDVGSSGPIMLQEYGSAVRFRNLKIKPLPAPKSAAVVAPLDDAWLKQVAALPAAEQVEAVLAKLKERNPAMTALTRGSNTGLDLP